MSDLTLSRFTPTLVFGPGKAASFSVSPEQAEMILDDFVSVAEFVQKFGDPTKVDRCLDTIDQEFFDEDASDASFESQ